MSALDDLMKEIQRLSDNKDGITDDLVKAIERYQREYERLLYNANFDTVNGSLKKSGQNYTNVAKLNAFDQLGFSEIGIDHIQNYNQVAKDHLSFNQGIGIETSLTFTDLEIVKALKQLDLAAMYGQAQLLDTTIKRNLVNAIATGANYEDTVNNIANDLLGAGEKLGTLARYADTYLRTSLFGLGRMVDKEIYDNAGGYEKYMYVGPLDAHTREFCLEHEGNTYTEEQINKFPEENGSGLDPWFAPGGWNCRHSLIPVGVTQGD